jgi:hypothetical protein
MMDWTSAYAGEFIALPFPSIPAKNKGRIPKDPPFANKKDYPTDLAFPTSTQGNQPSHTESQERGRGGLGDR